MQTYLQILHDLLAKIMLVELFSCLFTMILIKSVNVAKSIFLYF